MILEHAPSCCEIRSSYQGSVSLAWTLQVISFSQPGLKRSRTMHNNFYVQHLVTLRPSCNHQTGLEYHFFRGNVRDDIIGSPSPPELLPPWSSDSPPSS